MENLKNPEKSYEIHYSVLRTLKHILSPRPKRWKEIEETIRLEPTKLRELKDEYQAMLIPASGLVPLMTGIVPYLIEVLEVEQPDSMPLHKLRAMACEVLCNLIKQV